MNILLNLLALVIVLAAAWYVGRYGARLLGLGAKPSSAKGAASADPAGGCGSGCEGCSQRSAHGKT